MVDENGGLDWKMLREFCRDLVALRRGDHSGERLLIEGKQQLVEETCAMDAMHRGIEKGYKAFITLVKDQPKAKKIYEELITVITPELEKTRSLPPGLTIPPPDSETPESSESDPPAGAPSTHPEASARYPAQCEPSTPES
jgi:hypothetical protein